MIKISAKSQYGLRAMALFARSPNSIVALKEVSEKEEIPFDYLEKIIAKLEKADLVKAKKGVKGGYFLAKKAKKIKIRDIVGALEERTNVVQCLGKDYRCNRVRKCVTKKIWQKVQDSLDKTLNSVTLADILE